MTATDVRNFLRRFETTLKVLAREGRHLELESRFDEFQKLLGAWLDVAPPGAVPPERMRGLAIIDRFGGPMEVDTGDVARAAVMSGDSSTVVTVAEQLLRAALSCFHAQQQRLMEDFLDTLVFLYHQSATHASLADALGHRLDSGLHSLLMYLRSGNDREGGDSDDRHQIGTLLPAVRFALSLTHAAIRYENSQHASYFVERLFEHRRHRRQRFRRAMGPLTMSEDVLFDYVAVLLIGWSLHVLESDVCDNGDAAHKVLRQAIQQLPPVATLVAEWELLRSTDPHEPTIDAQLGIARWDTRDWSRDHRPGIVVTRWGSDDWLRLGLRAALLSTGEHIRGDEAELFTQPPGRFEWDVAKEREALEALAANDWLEIPPDKRIERVEAAIRIIEDRARGADAAYLRYVLASPLSDARVTSFRDEATQAYRDHSMWQGALSAIGIGKGSATCSPLRTLRGAWVPREYFLDDNNWASGFGTALGEACALQEAIRLFHLIETKGIPHGELETLATLPEKVRGICLAPEGVVADNWWWHGYSSVQYGSVGVWRLRGA